MKVCHLTSVHSRGDTRIFLKECKSLSKAGHNVSLIVADGLGDDIVEGVAIYDVGKTTGGRLIRFTKTTKKVYRKTLELDADICHFHDPELMLYAYLLKRKGKKVIYDTHEDLPRQVMSKPYLHPFAKKIISVLVEIIENFFAARFDAVVTATPFIRDRFLKLNTNTTDVNNYPLLKELHQSGDPITRKNQVCYLGGITEIRGIETLINACEHIQGKLVLAGGFSSVDLENKVKSLTGWKNVNYVGFVDRGRAKQILAESKAGIVTFLPEPNHINAQPNKMFEYMSASLPVICSDFDLWKSIVEGNKCGICVDPNSSKNLAKAINFLLEDDALVVSYGTHARQAVEEQYNWSVEEDKLLMQYQKLV